MASILCFLSFLSPLFLLASLSLAVTSSGVGLDADRLIRSLNLVPEEANIVDNGIGVVGDLLGKKIVERSFVFPGLLSDGNSVEDLGHHAGYYRLNRTHDARMFYFFFESRQNKKDPVVIWLTGGPGCSSELALFYENGPFTIANNLSLIWNDFGWDQASNLIYVDQPTGTGFSYSSDERDLRDNELDVSNDLFDFLQAFYAEHPEYAANDFYITGESYAGHYIPALASRVHQGNKANEGIHINLKGFAIGNGLTDPGIQYKAYTDYALDNRIIKQADYEEINKIIPQCEVAIKKCGTSGNETCEDAYGECQGIFENILAVAGDINYYDIRKQCEGSLCYDFSNMERFLNEKSVRNSLGVGNLSFVSCNSAVHSAMLRDWMRNLEVGIPALLEDGIKMLIYAGEYDLICNWLGNSRWVYAMEWSGKGAFASSPAMSFKVDSTNAGVLTSHGPLSFLKIHNAGHMVPMDQPKAALEMLRRWTNGNLTAESPSDFDWELTV